MQIYALVPSFISWVCTKIWKDLFKLEIEEITDLEYTDYAIHSPNIFHRLTGIAFAYIVIAAFMALFIILHAVFRGTWKNKIYFKRSFVTSISHHFLNLFIRFV